jgi:hypothetical protein
MGKKAIIAALKDVTDLSIKELEEDADRLQHYVMVDGYRITVNVWRPIDGK